MKEPTLIYETRRREAHFLFIDPIGCSHPRIRLDPRPPIPGIIREVFEKRNIELRREFIEKKYGGYKNFFQEFSRFHRILEATEEGALHCFELHESGNHMKMIVLEVRDSSHPENRYFIPVPRDVKTVHEARARTFKMKPEEFHPIVET